MGQQSNKSVKRTRRKQYLRRKKVAARLNSVTTEVKKSEPVKAPAKKAAKKVTAKKAAKKTAKKATKKTATKKVAKKSEE